MRCSDCRKNEAINTPWERFRSWLAWHIFPTDLKDEKANSFTQGFSDGYKMGAEHQKEKALEFAQLVDNSKPLEDLFPKIDIGKVLTVNKVGQLLLDDTVLSSKEVDELKHEVNLLKNTRIWKIILNTLKDKASKFIFIDAKDMRDLEH